MKHPNVPRNAIFLLAVLTILGSSAAQNQVTLQAGGGLGAVFPAGDFGSTTIDYYAGTKYGLSTGFNLHGKIRVGFGGFTLMGEVGYSSLSNSGEALPGQGKVDVSQTIISLKAGPEYHIDLPAAPLEPYVGANLALNIFNGETTFQGVSKVPSGTIDVPSASRFGIGIDGGALFSLGPLMSLDIAVHYNLMNLIGQSWEDADPTKDDNIESYQRLSDDKDPGFISSTDPKHFIGSSRAIHSIGLTASLMFGL